MSFLKSNFKGFRSIKFSRRSQYHLEVVVTTLFNLNTYHVVFKKSLKIKYGSQIMHDTNLTKLILRKMK